MLDKLYEVRFDMNNGRIADVRMDLPWNRALSLRKGKSYTVTACIKKVVVVFGSPTVFVTESMD